MLLAACVSKNSGRLYGGTTATFMYGLTPAPSGKGKNCSRDHSTLSYATWENFQRRLFPQISVSKTMFSRWGKTYALLWLCFLMVGPSYVRLRAFLKCVKGFCTDLGTERQVPDVPDCLIGYCKSINLRVPASATPQPFLFPSALLLCGWHHLFDGLIRFGLCSLGWFKPFLKQLKILNKLCRDHSGYLFDLLIERGYHGAAFIIKKISHTTFAGWRWRKNGPRSQRRE